MSCYVVELEHVDYLLEAGLSQSRNEGPLRWVCEGHFHMLTEENAGEVGAMLLGANLESYRHRYGHNEEALEEAEGQVYPLDRRRARWLVIDPVQVLKSVRCYEYQACEHPGWEGSEAQAYCQALTVRMIYRLPGMEDAVWGAPPAYKGKAMPLSL